MAVGVKCATKVLLEEVSRSALLGVTVKREFDDLTESITRCAVLLPLVTVTLSIFVESLKTFPKLRLLGVIEYPSCVPLPETSTLSGEVEELLTNEILAELLTAFVGVNVTTNFCVAEGKMLALLGETAKTGLLEEAEEIFSVSKPLLFTEIVSVTLVNTLTLLKSKLTGEIVASGAVSRFAHAIELLAPFPTLIPSNEPVGFPVPLLCQMKLPISVKA